ncbi:MAG TPA: glutamate racemase, partial [Clostridia bacterium]|nr:glutamate racemase [Clostridia bacterium]
GGLTVVKELNKILPCEDIVYFGDTGRLPYGTKGSDTIIKFATQDIRFLLSFDVKAIIIACGTVSSVAFNEACAASSVPVVGVVVPAATAAVQATKTGRIGILGTNATIRSGSYEKEILRIRPDAEVRGRPCPMFVPLVENGYSNEGNPVSAMIAHEYLDGYFEEKTDTLILGCTHYPLLRSFIRQTVGENITLIDAGRETAQAATRLLEENSLLNPGTEPGKCRFYVSDCSEDFTRLAGVFLEHSVFGYVEKAEIENY